MSTISVPLTPELEKFIQAQIDVGNAENKAAVVRRALKRLAEEEAVAAVLQAERELSLGKGMRGDLRTLSVHF